MDSARPNPAPQKEDDDDRQKRSPSPSPSRSAAAPTTHGRATTANGRARKKPTSKEKVGLENEDPTSARDESALRRTTETRLEKHQRITNEALARRAVLLERDGTLKDAHVVNADDVWEMMGYTAKQTAIRALKNDTSLVCGVISNL